MPRILCALLALVLAPVHATIYAASGSCDGAMSGCIDGKHQIWSYDDNLNRTGIYDFPNNDLPSWLFATKSCLFAAGTNSQYLQSYSIGPGGALTAVNKVDTGGHNPVFIDQVGDFLVAANYHGPDGGTTSALLSPVHTSGFAAPPSPQPAVPCSFCLGRAGRLQWTMSRVGGVHPGHQHALPPPVVTPEARPPNLNGVPFLPHTTRPTHNSLSVFSWVYLSR